jgi:hypothetical protein
MGQTHFGLMVKRLRPHPEVSAKSPAIYPCGTSAMRTQFQPNQGRRFRTLGLNIPTSVRRFWIGFGLALERCAPQSVVRLKTSRPEIPAWGIRDFGPGPQIFQSVQRLRTNIRPTSGLSSRRRTLSTKVSRSARSGDSGLSMWIW